MFEKTDKKSPHDLPYTVKRFKRLPIAASTCSLNELRVLVSLLANANLHGVATMSAGLIADLWNCDVRDISRAIAGLKDPERHGQPLITGIGNKGGRNGINGPGIAASYTVHVSETLVDVREVMRERAIERMNRAYERSKGRGQSPTGKNPRVQKPIRPRKKKSDRPTSGDSPLNTGASGQSPVGENPGLGVGETPDIDASEASLFRYDEAEAKDPELAILRVAQEKAKKRMRRPSADGDARGAA